MKIALAQINPKVGDLAGNAALIMGFLAEHSPEADLIVFPELALLGYPPKDLLLRRDFIAESQRVLLEQIAPVAQKAVLLGTVWPAESGRLYNSLVLLQNRQVAKVIHKKLLPNYEVFNEARYFSTGELKTAADFLVEVNGLKIASFVCEDLLGIEEEFKFYNGANPFQVLQNQRPDLIVCSSASPFRLGQPNKRIALARAAQKLLKAPLALVNQVGANDDLVFDGSSFALTADGQLLAQAASFQKEGLLVDFGAASPQKTNEFSKEELKEALVLGIRDYFRKTGFQRAFIGISGGIDSALVAALAARALGPENVTGVLMPSAYSSKGSLEDGLALLKNLKINSEIVNIEPILKAYLQNAGFQPLTLAEENLQSRIRGAILMGKANAQNALVLATGNKSEFAVGYSTLYGDMCGALAPIGDLWKTQVWELSAGIPEIPPQIVSKPPSAELRPDQLDSDSLPDYKLLDGILSAYIEKGQSKAEILQAGFPEAAVEKALKLLQISEFKRRQAPIILKVSKTAFGSGWLYPVAK